MKEKLNNQFVYFFFSTVWGIFVLLSTSFLLYVATKLFTLYLTYKTTTRIRLIEESLAKFPAVTICNLNLFARTKVEEQDAYTMDLIKTLYPTYDIVRPLNFSDKEQLEKTKGVNFSEIYDKTKLPPVFMYEGCRFNTVNLMCPNFGTLIMTDVGECLTINSREIAHKYNNFTTFRPGFNNGMQYQLNVYQFQYYSGPYSAGLQVSSNSNHHWKNLM